MELGLHSRPASMLVKTAGRFSSTLAVSSGGETVNGKSFLSLIILGAKHGAALGMVTEGPDAHALMDAIGDLFLRGFGESCAGSGIESPESVRLTGHGGPGPSGIKECDRGEDVGSSRGQRFAGDAAEDMW